MVTFPALGKFFFDPKTLPAGVESSDLGVYHFKDGAWVYLGGYLDIASNSLTVEMDSFSVYAIGEKSGNPSLPFDSAIIAWILAIAAIVLATYGCVKFRKGKNGGPATEGFPELEFDP